MFEMVTLIFKTHRQVKQHHLANVSQLGAFRRPPEKKWREGASQPRFVKKGTSKDSKIMCYSGITMPPFSKSVRVVALTVSVDRVSGVVEVSLIATLSSPLCCRAPTPDLPTQP